MMTTPTTTLTKKKPTTTKWKPVPALSNKQLALLNRLYRDPDSLSYMGSISHLYKVAQEHDASLERRQVRRWLLAQPSYAIAPPMRYKSEREKIIVYNRNDLGAADLAEFQPLSKFNNGIHYVLVYRNCFTKRISVGFLYSKHGPECARVFRDMLINQIKFIPRTLVTDRGGEFLNPFFRSVCAEFNIKMFQPRKGKAVHAENAILYLKTRLYRYMRDTNNKRYLEILPQIVSHYNNTVRPTLGMAPNAVEAHNQFRLFHRMYGRYLHNTVSRPRFSIGDTVRVRLAERTFEKSYFPKFSTELYRITQIFTHSQPAKYMVVALEGFSVTLKLLERELLLVPMEVPEAAPREIGLHRAPRKRAANREVQPVDYGQKFRPLRATLARPDRTGFNVIT